MTTTRFWGTRLQPGIAPRNLKTFYAAAFATIMLAVLVNALQPYLLTTFLGLPVRQHGQASGQIGFVAEVVLVVCVGLWGGLSDRAGRRLVYALGFGIMALGFAITPWSGSIAALAVTRGVYSVGVAATTAMLATIVADYVDNRDRGKANAIMGVMNGLGAVTAAIGLAKLPRAFQAAGQDGIAAGWSTYLVAAGLSVGAAALMWAGLARGRGKKGESEHSTPLALVLRDGVVAAKRDPGVALAYASAFVARADLAVAGVFLPLWLTKHHAESVSSGLSGAAQLAALDAAAASGVADGGKLIAIVGGAGLCFAPVIGVLCDRIHRVRALAIGLAFNVVGYGLTFFVGEPTGGLLIAAAVVIGCGQVGGVIASQVLIQQQAPAATRGAVIGAFGTCGALGIMFCLLVGGWLFDAWTEAGPFVMLAGLNLVVVIAALALAGRIRAPKAA